MSTFIAKEYEYHVKLLKLINEARDDGIVLTIESEPRHPLAMGNYDMRPSVRYSRAAQVGTLWMLNIEGPDDIVAAPSFIEAVKVAAEFNAYWREYTARAAARTGDQGNFPTIRAVILPWDASPEAHAESVEEYWHGYLGYEESLKALKAIKP